MRMADAARVVNDQSLAEVNSMMAIANAIDDQLGSGREGVGSL
jgi:hypothetical protein